MNLREAHRRSEAAHSLPEAVIAALVVGTMLVSLYAGFSSGFGIAQSTREELRASQIVLERVEALRLYTWSQLQDTNRFLKPTFVDYYNPAGVATDTASTIYRGTVVAKTPNLTTTFGPVWYRTNMLEVTVKVYWTNYVAGQEVLRSKQLQTYVSRYGMQNYQP